MSRADARAQVQFLNRLPIYRIKIEEHGSPVATPPEPLVSAPPVPAPPVLAPPAPPAEYLRFPESIDPTSRPHAQAAG